MDIYYYIIIFFGLISVLYVLNGEEHKAFPPFSIGLAVVLSLFVLYKIAFYPIPVGGDKANYLKLFNTISLEKVVTYKDVGFAYYVYFVRSFFSSSQMFFTITAFIYLLGYWIFALKAFNKKYAFIYLLMVFGSFAFTAYGVNTLRAGFALSMFLIAISYRKNILVFLAFGLLSVLSHKAMSIPLAFFILATYFNRPKTYLGVWILAFIISFIEISAVTEFLQENLFSFDDRSAGYFKTEKTHYKVGFRVDFIIYSALPILVSSYYLFKLKIEDKLYSQLFSTYLLTNAIWLLVIRMAFTDRVAYLSWFLIPFLTLYPLLKYKLPIKQRIWVASILTVAISFTAFMYFS